MAAPNKDRESDLEIALSDESDGEMGSTDEVSGSCSDEDEEDSSSTAPSSSSSGDSDASDSESDDSMSSSDSEQSACLSEVWSDAEEHIIGRPTTEAQEAQLRSDFKEMMEHHDLSDVQLLNSLLVMSMNPVVANYRVWDMSSFDWKRALERANTVQVSVNGQLFFDINENIAKLCAKFNQHSYVVDYLLQALSVRPDNDDLWWQCAMSASKSARWNAANFAIERLKPSVPKARLLAVVQFCTLRYEECLETLATLLKHENEVDTETRMFATVLKDEIANLSDTLLELVEEKFKEEEGDEDSPPRWAFVVATELQRAAIVDSVKSLRKPLDPKPCEFESLYTDIEETISPSMKIEDFGACLCNLYDRIDRYSIVIFHKIKLTLEDDSAQENTAPEPQESPSNESISDEVVACLNGILDVVCCTEDLLDQVLLVKPSPPKPKPLKRKLKKRMSSMALYQRRSTRYIEHEDSTDDDEEDQQHRLLDLLDVNEELSERRSEQYELRKQGNGEGHPARVVTFNPPSAESFRTFLRNLLSDSSREFVIKELLGSFLAYLISEQFEITGVLRQIFVEVYKRWSSIEFTHDEGCCVESLNFHLAAFELGCSEAYDFCTAGLPEDTEDFKKVIRLHWASAKRESLGVDVQVNTLKEIEEFLRSDRVQPRESIFSLAPGRQTISAESAHTERMEIVRATQLKELDSLISSSNYDQIISLLESHFNWSEGGVEEVVNNAFILVDCYVKTGNKEKALEWALRVIRSSMKNGLTDADRVLKLLESLEVDANIAEHLLHDFAYYLYLLHENDKFFRSPIFWRRLYEVTKCREGGISKEVVERHMRESGEEEHPVDEAMPSRALSVLQYAHSKLGDLTCCASKEGSFLLYYLSELNRVVSDKTIKQMFFTRTSEKTTAYYDVAATFVDEFNQILFCLFGGVAKRVKMTCEEHHSPSDFEATWKEALLVVPLLFREELHLFDDKLKIAPESIDILLKKFDFLWKETYPKTEEEFSRFLGGDALDDWPRVAPEDPEKDRIRSTVFYALALHYYQGNVPKEAHAFSRRFLTAADKGEPAWTASAWAIFAHTYSILLLSDTDENVLQNAEKCLFAFNVGFNVKEEVAIMHFEYADSAYQFRTRINRFASTLDRCAARGKALKLLPRLIEDCKKHIDRANVLNNAEAEPEQDIEWLVCYFKGKVAEKLKEPAETVLYWYYQCAKIFERQGYQYPSKISKKKQENLEPIELHYRIYSYIWKRLRDEEDVPSLHDMNVLAVYAEHFENHGVTRKFLVSPEAEEFFLQQEPDIAVTLNELTYAASLSASSMDADVLGAVSDTVERVHLRERCLALCESNFGLIVSRYPYHYKAHYRIAEMEQNQGHFKKAVSHLFQKVFKRKNFYSVFENCISIQRNDIERSGSYEFHMDRLMEISLYCCFKTNDIEKLCSLLYSLGLAAYTEGVLKENKRKEKITLARKFILTLIERNDGNVLKLSSREKETFWKTAMSYHDKAKMYCDEITRKSFDLIQKRISEAAKKHRDQIAAKIRQSAATRKVHVPQVLQALPSTSTQFGANDSAANLMLLNYLAGLQSLQQSPLNATAFQQLLGSNRSPAQSSFSHLLKRAAPSSDTASSSGVPPSKISKQS